MSVEDLLAFFADRLKVHLRDKGARHDLIDAVFALPGQDDLALVVKRVEALGEFLKTDDGANLLAGVKRASNILTIEEKKDKTRYDGEVHGNLLTEPGERELAAAIAKVKFDTQAAINVENFAGAMRALAELRAPVDAFLRQGDGERRQRRAARQPPEAALRDPLGYPERRGFQQDRRVRGTASKPRASCNSRVTSPAPSASWRPP